MTRFFKSLCMALVLAATSVLSWATLSPAHAGEGFELLLDNVQPEGIEVRFWEGSWSGITVYVGGMELMTEYYPGADFKADKFKAIQFWAVLEEIPVCVYGEIDDPQNLVLLPCAGRRLSQYRVEALEAASSLYFFDELSPDRLFVEEDSLRITGYPEWVSIPLRNSAVPFAWMLERAKSQSVAVILDLNFNSPWKSRLALRSN